MPSVNKFGDKFVTPTKDGQIEWLPESWGAIVTEKTFHPALSFGSKSSWTEKKLRVPWSVIDAVRETGPKPEPKKPAKFQFRGMDAEVIVELQGNHGTIRVPIGQFSSFVQDAPHSGFGEFRIVVGSPLMERLYLASTEASKKMGPSW